MEGLKEAIDYIAQLGRESRAPKVVDIDGKRYGTQRLTRIDELEKASPIEATTLTALIDYIKGNRFEFMDMYPKMIIQVETPMQVSLFSSLDVDRNRETLFRCKAFVPEFRFDAWYGQEEFIIALQSKFEPTEDLDVVRICAANIVNMKSAEFSDDGVTQQATIKTGVARQENAIVPNPVNLIPWRTFREIVQPESPFVFRISEGKDGAPLFKLVTADGGAWKNQAMEQIREYITEKLEELPVPDRERFTVIA